jgi:uncharacterized protein
MTQTRSLSWFVSQIRAVDDLRGPAGRLEALLNTGRDDAPYAALVCHPHPLGGGTMHNKAVYHAMKAFSPSGFRCCASTFAAWAERRRARPRARRAGRCARRARLAGAWTFHKRPILFAGFSFGS